MPILKITGIVFCILMAGCMSSHRDMRDYYTPPVYEDLKSPSITSGKNTFREQITPQEETKRAEEIAGKKEWDLRDCINLSLINEEQLKIKGEAYYQTKWLYQQALATWFPSLSLESSKTTYDPSAPAKYDYWLKIRQPIFNAGREFIGIANSKELGELRKYELKQNRDILILAVADAFYQTLGFRNELEAMETLREYTENYLVMVKAREDARIGKRKDTLLAEAALFDIKARIARTTSLMNSARLNLQILVGVPLTQNFVDTLLVSEMPAYSNEAISKALDNRAEIKIAEQQIKLAEAEVDLAMANYLPQANLDWNRYLQSKNSSNENIDWTLLLTISLPIDNGGKYARLKETHSKLRQAILAKEKAVKIVQNDVQKSYQDLQSFKSDIEAREKGLAAAKETADIVLEEYKLGLSTSVEVLFTKNIYEQAKVSLEKSKIDLKMSYLKLKFAMGLLPEEF
ncbi:MAG: TolC family protein [Planctomycetota bacterium]